MKYICSIFVFCFCVLTTTNAIANVQLIDINKTAGYHNGEPQDFVTLRNKLYFSADDGIHGRELHEYDPETGEVRLIADLEIDSGVGSNPEYFVVMNDVLYFNACDETHGCELFKYEPDTDAVSIAASINPGFFGSFPTHLTVLNNNLYFIALSTGWLNSEAVFVLKNNGTELEKLANLSSTTNGGKVESLVAYNNHLYFSAENDDSGRELYRFNTNTKAVSLVSDIHASGDGEPENLTVHAGKLFFSASNDESGTQLYQMDDRGNPNVVSSFEEDFRRFKSFYSYQNKLYFSHGLNFYNLDESGNIELIRDVESGVTLTSVEALVEANGRLYIAGHSSLGNDELHTFDPDSGTINLVSNISPEDYKTLKNLHPFDGQIYMQTDDGVNGRELYRYSPDSGNTELAANINLSTADSRPSNMVEFEGTLYFEANDQETDGNALFKIERGSLEPSKVDGVIIGNHLVAYNNKLYFSGNEHLYSYKPGDSERQVVDSSINFPTYSSGFVQYNNKLYFTGFTEELGYELYVFDGATEEVTLVEDIRPGDDSSLPKNFVVYNGKLYFSADDGDNGRELFVYDSTSDSINLAADLNNSSWMYKNGNPEYLTVLGDKLYFQANIGGSDFRPTHYLVEFDGNNDSYNVIEKMHGDIYLSSPSYLTVYRNKIYFSDGFNLNSFDPEGNQVVRHNSFIDEIEGNSPQNLQVYKDKLYYSADAGYGYGRELFVFDEDTGEIGLLSNLNPSHESSNPKELTVFNNKLYFVAETQASGIELFVYDSNKPVSGDVIIRLADVELYELEALDNITDADGIGELSYQWYRGENEIPNAQQARYLVTENDVANSITVVISYTDGEGNEESLTSQSFVFPDLDGDSIIDYLDPDDDNDGILDEIDNDNDNDGVSDDEDLFPLDANEQFDTDGDGIGDNADQDTHLTLAFNQLNQQMFDVEGQGFQTDISLFLQTTLSDIHEGLELVSVVTGELVQSGIHDVEFTVKNDNDIEFEFSASLNVLPQIRLNHDINMIRGSTEQIYISLNGTPSQYPVVIEFELSDGLTTEQKEIIITEGWQASLNVTSTGDWGEHYISFFNAQNAALSDSTKIKVNVDENYLPKVSGWIVEPDTGTPTQIVKSDKRTLALRLDIDDDASPHEVEFILDGNRLHIEHDYSGYPYDIELEVPALSIGRHQIDITIKELYSTDAKQAQNSVEFYVVSSDFKLTEADTDLDGHLDVEEGYADADLDGIPNYLDNSYDSHLPWAGSEAFTPVHLHDLSVGSIRKSFDSGLSSDITLSIDELASKYGESALQEDVEAYQTAVFDVITSKVVKHAYLTLHLPSDVQIAQESKLRLFNPQIGWVGFTEDDDNTISSSQTPQTDCFAFMQSPGVSKGADCLVIKLQDGGVNDFDGEANGTVSITGVFVTLKPSSDEQSGSVESEDSSTNETASSTESSSISGANSNGNSGSGGSGGGVLSGWYVLGLCLLYIRRLSTKERFSN